MTRDPGRRIGCGLLCCASLLLLALAVACDEFRPTGKKLVVIGIDGMDPDLLQQYMGEGLMPHFQELAEAGTFHPLGTSNPPQSPVAWSSFITGMDPGGHGVFDFLHRDPATYHPVSSTQTSPPASNWDLPGDYWMPSPFADEPEAVRQGTPFWEWFEDAGIRCDVYRMPAAYPIDQGSTDQLVLTDMGTPDLQGGIDGVYTYYTSSIPKELSRIQVGKHLLVDVDDGVVRTVLRGPVKPFEKSAPVATTPLTVSLDPVEPAALIEVTDGDAITLREGEWSDWCRVTFDLGFFQSVTGICQFYLQSVRPEFRLYASPVNIDPEAPAQPISTPDDDAIADIARAIGPFYTQGLAEETKALQEHVLTDGEFLSQCDVVTDERMRMLDYALDRFDDGLLFFYFSAIDLRCHMMWRHIEEGHPAREEELARQYGNAIRDAYVQMDGAVGRVRERIGKDTPIVVMSDHGFAPFTRKVNLNQWLKEQGYLFLDAQGEEMWAGKGAAPSVFGGIDWSRTKAYSVGFNGIYVNAQGREAEGCVPPAERQALAREIGGKLATLEDPERGGRRPVRRTFLREDIYHGAELEKAPDLVVGFDRGYGASDDTALGDVPHQGIPVVEDNESYWSGNHLMDPEVVPGILLTNLPVQAEGASIVDVTATLLAFFGLPQPAEVVGKPLL